jgi:hypothetical protein
MRGLPAAVLLAAMVSATEAVPIDRLHAARDLVPSTINTNKGPVSFDLNKAALIVIDMQVYFLSTKDAPGLALIPQLNATVAAFRAAGAPVIWVNWGQRSDMRNFPGDWKPPVHVSVVHATHPHAHVGSFGIQTRVLVVHQAFM